MRPQPQKQYRLLGSDGQTYLSTTPGELGGNSKDKIYGRLDCPSANRYLDQGYPAIRVFFADEAAAIAAGYRPCYACMRERYRQWKQGGSPGTTTYPWLITPAKA